MSLAPVSASLARLTERALDLLFPRRCAGCGSEGRFLCRDCLAALKPLVPPICAHCGKPSRAPGLCSDCRVRPLALAGIRAAFVYEGPLRDAILQFKYRGVSSLADELAPLLCGYLVRRPLACDVIVAVPLSADRLKARGYNQAAMLASRMGALLRLPEAPRALRRVRSTGVQARLASWEQRYANVAGAFQAEPRWVTGKRVLVVDDVCTTGATLEACGQALKAAGATAAWGLALAREV